MLKVPACLLLLLPLLGCGQSAGAGAGPSSSGSANARSAQSSGAAEKSAGSCKDCNPQMVAAAREVALCPWQTNPENPVASEITEAKCPALAAWRSSMETTAEKQQGTLLALISDPDRSVRWLVATTLSKRTASWRTNGPAAESILSQAAIEKDPAVSYKLGALIALLDLDKTGQRERVLDLLSKRDNDALRRAILDGILVTNQGAEVVRALEVIARSSDTVEIRTLTLRMLSAFGKPKDEVCELLREMAHDATPEVAGEAAFQSAGASGLAGCAKSWDALLGDIDKQNQTDHLVHQAMAGALDAIAGNAAVTPAQKSRAIAIAKRVVENLKNDAMTRQRALALVKERDPSAKAFLARFKDLDEDPLMREMLGE